MREDFNQAELDSTRWSVGTWKLGRCLLALKPQLKEGVALLKVMNWNPSNATPHLPLAGTEIFTRQKFERGTGLEIEARVRLPKAPAGLVASLFTYTAVEKEGQRLVDELDVEMLTTKIQESDPKNSPLLLTSWHDWNASKQDHDEREHHNPRQVAVRDFDPAAWNILTLRWLPDRVEWLANGKLIRTEREIVPDDPTPVRLNFWLADAGWEDAFDEAIKPAKSEQERKSWNFEVDYVEVRRVSE